MEQTLVERDREMERMAESSATSTAQIANDSKSLAAPEALFPENEARDFRKRWEQVQTGFVDEPRTSVEQADQLVAAAIKRLAEMFAEARTRLEHEWDKGDNVSTEDLRQALRKYRAFFDRLLSV